MLSIFARKRVLVAVNLMVLLEQRMSEMTLLVTGFLFCSNLKGGYKTFAKLCPLASHPYAPGFNVPAM